MFWIVSSNFFLENKKKKKTENKVVSKYDNDFIFLMSVVKAITTFITNFLKIDMVIYVIFITLIIK
jgi:hypothetical protein